MNIQKISENAIQTLQDIHRSVMSDQTKAEIERRLIELAQEAFLLRTNGKEGEIGTGVITGHVQAVSANAVETYRLQSKLSAMAFYARFPDRAPVRH
jgi:hypothetical protein